MRRPTTAQKTITFEKMYRDGVCLVRKGYYTRMIEFEDMDYILQDDDTKSDILGQYSQFINYFDPGIKIELFLFNRRIGEQHYMKSFDIPEQNDGFDEIRREFSGILKELYSKGNNGILKGKYLIFGIEAQNHNEAAIKLKNIEKDVVLNFNHMGVQARGLNGEERLKLLHEFYHQDSLEPFRFSFKELSESGKSVKDYIAPLGFDFRYPSRFKAGHMYGSVHYVDISAPQMTDEFLKNLLDLDENITISLHFQTMEAVKAIKMLKGKLSNVQKMKIEEQKKAVRSGYDMDILPTDIITYEKDTMELLNDLNSSNQKLIDVSMLIACFGRTKKEMETLTQRVSGIIQKANFKR